VHASHNSIYRKQLNYLEEYLLNGEFMPRAFILVNVEIRSENNVIKNLRKNGFVEEVYVSNSPYDLIIKIKAETMDELNEAVYKIRTTNQVKSTLTLMMMEE
jgi:DNA-binding Lrp family transcriptional regulator